MTRDEAFLHDIVTNPADDVVRLIYADWLNDHGQEDRAEFIRVQCELWKRRNDYDSYDLMERASYNLPRSNSCRVGVNVTERAGALMCHHSSAGRVI